MTPRVRVAFLTVMVVVLAWGVFVRTWGLGSRAFWRDEACVADLVTRSSWGQLLRQSEVPSPPLFAATAKFLGSIGSPPEVALRLLPVLCGIACLPLSYLAARTLRAPRTMALAGMALSASSLILVIWSREFRQYSVEACVSVLLALLVFRVRRCPPTRGRAPLAAGILIVCLVGPWFGYGVLFPAAALLSLLLLRPPVPQPGKRFVCLGLVAFAMLGVSTLTVLHLAAADQAANRALMGYLGNWFIDPMRIGQWFRAGGYAALASGMTLVPPEWFPIRNWMAGSQLGVWMAAPALVVWGLALIGLATWPRKGRLELAVWTLLPWLLMLLGAVAHRYPFGVTRMMVVLMPPLLLAVAAGLIHLCRIFSERFLKRGGPGMVAGLLCTFVPAVYVVNVPLHHSYWFCQDFSALVHTLESRRKPGEAVLVTVNAVPCVRYYAGRSGATFHYHPVTAGTLPLPGFDYDALNRETVRAVGSRCWVLATSEPNERQRVSLEKALRDAGYELRVEAESPGEEWYGRARLLLATKRADVPP